MIAEQSAPKVREVLADLLAEARAEERERVAQAIERDAWVRDDDSQWRDGMEDAARIARTEAGS